MKVILGHAVSSENGNKYGKPGDQTGNELRKQEWYISGSGWTGVFRWKDQSLAKKAAKYVSDCCDSVHVGYSQSLEPDGRESLDMIVSRYKYDVSALIEDVNCDCSTLIASAVRSVGGKVGRGMSTANEEEALNKSGLFTELKESKYLSKKDNLKVGDILWRKGHTAMVIAVIKDKEEKEMADKKDKQQVAEKTATEKFAEDTMIAMNKLGEFDRAIMKELGIGSILNTQEAVHLLLTINQKLKEKHLIVTEQKCKSYLVRFSSPFRIYKDMVSDTIVATGVSTGIYTIVAESSDGLRGKLKSGAGWVKLSEAQKL